MIVPCALMPFFGMVAEGRRGPKKPQPILAPTPAWKAASLAAGSSEGFTMATEAMN